ncbi:MAG: shikimate kinase [Magnetococcales bacterium]|nr:shikimate kinase [Magnetococcales bacterium]
MNVVLVGARGVGKTTVARQLGSLTKRPVLSTDLLISYDHGGLPIPRLLEESGGDWRLFREWEYAVVEKVSALDGLIIDAGGGVVVDLDDEGREVYSERKMAALKARGQVVWIHGDLARAAVDARQDANRPALSPTQSELEVMVRRLPFYRRAADVILEPAAGLTALHAAEWIVEHLELSRHGGHPQQPQQPHPARKKTRRR